MDKILKIAINTSPLKGAHAVRGVGSYTKNLVDALKKRNDIKLVDLKENPDVVHYPYFDLFFLTLPFNKTYSTVVTIHDVIPLLYPEHYPKGIRGWIKFQIQKFSLKGVSAVIADSETSKKDILRFLDVPQEKVHTIHLAPANNFKPITNHRLLITARKKYQLPDSFVLYVGDVNYNKNVLGLVKACKVIKTPLVIVGKQAVEKDFDRSHPENQPLVQLIEQYGSDLDILRVGFVSDKDLVAIYNLATVYCQPSFYEGFGLPVLEAMACGCPVVAGRTQALVEVAGDGAIFVDPKDYNEIAKGLQQLISNSQKRNKLIKKGLEHVKKFNWLKVAGETVKIYKNVAQK